MSHAEHSVIEVVPCMGGASGDGDKSPTLQDSGTKGEKSPSNFAIY
jgi:hypothetical protein